MNSFNFYGVGVLGGVVLSGPKQNLATFSYNGEKQIENISRQKFLALRDIPFLRGIFVMIGYLITFFQAFDLSLIVLNQKLIAGDVERKLKVRKSLIKFYALVLLVAFVSFLVAPVGIYLLMYFFVPSGLANFVMAITRVISVFAFLLMLKMFSVSKDIYRHNYAINKVNNAMFGTKYLDYKQAQKSSGFCVYSAGNFLVFSLLICYLFVPVITFNVHFVFNVLIKIAFAILFICLAYELLVGVEYTYRKNAFMRVIAFPFLQLSRLTTVRCKRHHMQTVFYGYEELIQMTATRKDFDKERESYRKVYSDIKNRLFECGITENREADYLICDTLGIDKTELFLKDSFSKQEISKLNKVVEQRVIRKPLCKILNKKCFYGRDFFVDQNVLSPRQETELLTNLAIDDILANEKKIQVLDLCTGSGAIAITVALETKSKVVASDKSQKALNVAQKNAQNLGAKVQFYKSDMFKNLNDCGKFDIIISNPPYIPTQDIQNLDVEVKDYDPVMSLDGGDDGLDFYKIIARKAPEYLKEGGRLYLEIGFDQGESVKALLSRNFVDIEVIKDYDDNDRIVVARKG